jgi:nucleoside-diphosphate-sugar epimerase
VQNKSVIRADEAASGRSVPKTGESERGSDIFGNLTFDTSKPGGTMRKVMDVSRINALGWRRKTLLKDSIALSYQDMLSKIR